MEMGLIGSRKRSAATAGALLLSVAVGLALSLDGRVYPADPYSRTVAGSAVGYSNEVELIALTVIGSLLVFAVISWLGSWSRGNVAASLLFALLAIGNGVLWGLFTMNHAPFVFKYPMPVSIAALSVTAALLLGSVSFDGVAGNVESPTSERS